VTEPHFERASYPNSAICSIYMDLEPGGRGNFNQIIPLCLRARIILPRSLIYGPRLPQRVPRKHKNIIIIYSYLMLPDLELKRLKTKQKSQCPKATWQMG
jgi:hypothetical protein